jgi:hypothetical protein
MGEPEARKALAESHDFAARLSNAGMAYERTREIVRDDAAASVHPDTRDNDVLMELDAGRFFVASPDLPPDRDRPFKDKHVDELATIASERPLTKEDWSSVFKNVLIELEPVLAMGFKPDLRWLDD